MWEQLSPFERGQCKKQGKINIVSLRQKGYGKKNMCKQPTQLQNQEKKKMREVTKRNQKGNKRISTLEHRANLIF